jgi:adenylate cyclase
MRDPPLILAVDDTPQNLDLLRRRLSSQGYEVTTAEDGEAALERTAELLPDLILLDIMMPRLDGIETVRRLKANPAHQHIPVILVTAKSDPMDVIEGLDAGGDDYLTKPIDHAALLARVRSMLRMKALHDKVHEQARELEDWSRLLERRVAEQIEQIARMDRLRRFLPPQVAEILVGDRQGGDPLQSHRQDVTVVVADLRGFTSFAETAEPEEVLTVLREYHHCIGTLVAQHDATLERFVGDGVLALFNDPLPQEDHTGRAIQMTLEMRQHVQVLCETWAKRGYALGFGVGVTRGYATVGGVGFERRIEYSVIGTVPNLASRLCDEAKTGQILVSRPVIAALEDRAEFQLVGNLSLKGFHRPVPVFEILGLRKSVATHSTARRQQDSTDESALGGRNL